MSESSFFAVITGDVTGSSRISTEQRGRFLEHLKGLFRLIADTWPDLIRAPFHIYRGDSFQGVLFDPSAALRISLVVRTGLRSGFSIGTGTVVTDARMAIGVGGISYLPEDSSAEADGEAFRRSGQLLDNMSDPFRLLIATPSGEADEELNVELGLLDAIIDKWSVSQAEAMEHFILGYSQREIARKIDISPAAVNQRLKTAGSRAVENALKRFENVINGKVCMSDAGRRAKP